MSFSICDWRFVVKSEILPACPHDFSPASPHYSWHCPASPLNPPLPHHLPQSPTIPPLPHRKPATRSSSRCMSLFWSEANKGRLVSCSLATPLPKDGPRLRRSGVSSTRSINRPILGLAEIAQSMSFGASR